MKCEPSKCSIQIELSRVFIIMTHSTNQPETYNWIEMLKMGSMVWFCPYYYAECLAYNSHSTACVHKHIEKSQNGHWWQLYALFLSHSLCFATNSLHSFWFSKLCMLTVKYFSNYSFCVFNEEKLRVNIPIPYEFIQSDRFWDKGKVQNVHIHKRDYALTK